MCKLYRPDLFMPYKDKNKQKEFQRNEYLLHKDRYSERNRTRRAERKKWFFENVLKGLKCSKCPENDTACLDFHHIDPAKKEGNVSMMINEFRSKDAILKEVSKCIVVCANCHRKIHFYEDKEHPQPFLKERESVGSSEGNPDDKTS